MLKKIFFYIFLILFTFILGYLTRYLLKNSSKSSLKFTRSQNKKYQLINPLLDCEIDNSMSFVPVNTIQKKILDSITNSTNINEISVYFRDLNNGASFGINENTKFAPASLLKMPIMIAYLKLAENNPYLLNKKIYYPGSQQTIKNIEDINSLIIGNDYTINELILRMMSLSDNNAFELLYKNIDRETIREIYKELDIIYPDDTNTDDYIMAKSYAGLFRILYNSTYLNREMSEKALSYMLKSDFHSGIQAGIPENITSALKFGIRDIDNQGLIQLHDCGIVYKPEKPFIICIMTKGNNIKELTNVIKVITNIIYSSI